MKLFESDITRFWGKVVTSDGCWEWMAGKFQNGYGAFFLYNKLYKAHRVAWAIQNGPIPEGMFVCHHCDNPGCVRPDHLFIGTASDNSLDRDRKGRNTSAFKSGELNPQWGRRKGITCRGAVEEAVNLESPTKTERI